MQLARMRLEGCARECSRARQLAIWENELLSLSRVSYVKRFFGGAKEPQHGAVGTLVGAGFKPALLPHARCNRIAVISRELKLRRTDFRINGHTVNAERGRVSNPPYKHRARTTRKMAT